MRKRSRHTSNSVVEQVVENSLQPIQDVIDGIEKDFGKGSIMPLDGCAAACANHPSISSGTLSLDRALGIWGYPRGRVVEVFGPESSGKTTLALHAVAEAQKAGGYAAFVDAEHALDSEYAKNLGVDTSLLLISQPDHGEQGLEIAEKLITSNRLDIVVVDSVAALTPRAEIEGDMGDSHMGLQARLMSQAMRKLTGIISKTNTILLFINQIRHKIGVLFGNPETTTGGNALKFYASQRLDIRRIGAIKHGNEVIGNRTRIKVVKNKMAPPLKFTEVDVIYGQGISRIADLIDLATQIGIVEKAGAWYSYNGERIGQGKENTRRYLLTNEDMADEIYQTVKDCLMKESGVE